MAEERYIIKFWDGDVRECRLEDDWFVHVLHSGCIIHKDDKRIKEIKPLAFFAASW